MRIALLGDIGLFGRFDLLTNNSVYEYFSEVESILQDFDYVVGNFETPFTRKTRSSITKSAHLKTDPRNVELLKFLNINAVNLANNHIFDYGKNEVVKTLRVLENAGIDYFGINNKVLFLEKEMIAFTGFCCLSTNAFGYLTERKKMGVNILDGSTFKSTLENHQSRGYLNISSLHFGDEHIHYPRIEHVRMARDTAGSVTYVLYGHHPHVIQGLEEFNGSLLAYSLGNFCFDDVYSSQNKFIKIKRSKENKESFLLSIDITNASINHYETIPIFDDGHRIAVKTANSNIQKKIKKYSEYLKLDDDEFIRQRNQALKQVTLRRKAIRNIKWYINRMNFNMLGTKIKGRINKKKYKYYMRAYLS